MAVIQFTREIARTPEAPKTTTTWLTDFNDVDADGLLIAEPMGIAGRKRIGDLIELSDGYYYCQGLIAERHDDYVMVRPNWATWRGPSIETTSASPHWYRPSTST